MYTLILILTILYVISIYKLFFKEPASFITYISCLTYFVLFSAVGIVLSIIGIIYLIITYLP